MPNPTGNPNHPVTRQLENEWHKFAAILLFKYRDVLPNVVTISSTDLDEFERSGFQTIVAHAHREMIDLKLVTDAEAEALLRQHGGRPT